MENQNLQRWALIAEIIGGIAVVFSLVFVGLEVRQSSEETALNTRAIEVNAYQDLIAQIILLNSLFIGDPALSELWASTYDCEELESRADYDQLIRYFLSVRRHGDMAYHQYELGLITEERLNNALGILIEHVSDNYVARYYWNNIESSSPFTVHVNKLIEDRGRADAPCPGLVPARLSR